MSGDQPVAALVVAAGLGTRLPGGPPKGLRSLGGVPLFLHSLLTFDRAASVSALILVAPPGREDEVNAVASGRLDKPLTIVAGGMRRQDSVLRGLLAAQAALGGRTPQGPAKAGEGTKVFAAGKARKVQKKQETETPRLACSESGVLVAVHDAARPFVDLDLIQRTIDAARSSGAAVPMVRVVDTVREIDPSGRVSRVLDRDRLRLAQTPQTARLDWLIEAYQRAEAGGMSVTDEGGALVLAGRDFITIEGSGSNFKITTPEELEAAEGLLAVRRGPAETRLGYGEDRHARAPGRPFVLAGVVLDSQNGPLGHSDADPLCHALIDALLGAAGAGNIGEMFPETDPRWAGASGLSLLRAAAGRIAAEGWQAINVDAVVIADSPRLAPHVDEIRRKVAEAIGADPARVSVKGKRAEGLGFEGTGQGVSCRAVAFVQRFERK